MSLRDIPELRNPGAAPTRAAGSFDDLFGAGEQGWRHRETKRIGSGQIDDEIELGRLLDRDVASLRTTQNFIDITSGAPEQVQKVRSIGNQTSRFDPLPGIVNCWKPCGEHQGLKSNPIGK